MQANIINILTLRNYIWEKLFIIELIIVIRISQDLKPKIRISSSFCSLLKNFMTRVSL